MTAELATGIADLLGCAAGGVEVEPLAGGASRQTFLVSAEADRYVLRRDPPGAPSNTLRVEADLLDLAAAAGVPVPDVIAFEPAGGRFETDGILMREVEGTSVAPRILRREELEDARAGLVRELGAALARIHSIAAPASLPGGGGDPWLDACDGWATELDRTDFTMPALEAGLRRLRLDRPEAPIRQAVVHGDFRLGNLIVSPAGLAAVIDWELAHTGDPAEDIGWLCIRSWRFGNDALPVAGLGGLDEFLGAYEAAGGTVPDRRRIAWWEAMGNVKWAVVCARQAADHLSGVRRSHELASLGRRACEPEWDLGGLMRVAT
jgi:aminoglycoside phosphotransferase (APT) family kinase protein